MNFNKFISHGNLSFKKSSWYKLGYILDIWYFKMNFSPYMSTYWARKFVNLIVKIVSLSFTVMIKDKD